MLPVGKKIKTLLFSTLYPSSVRPGHGVFVETRLRELLSSGQVEARVVAPVPWFPFTHPRFKTYAQMAKTPRREVWNGVEVLHPRYALPPAIGQNVAPFLLAAGALPKIKELIRGGFDFDVIDAHFFYPDGVAAAIIAKKLGKPFVCTARGSDINLYKYAAIPRRLIKWAIGQSAANIGVCQDLINQIEDLGGDSKKSYVMRNGVDLVRFQPVDRNEARKYVGIDSKGPLLVSVGNLVALKGHDLVIQMLAGMPDAQLIIVGSGILLEELKQLAHSIGVGQRVKFAGQRKSEELKYFFSAADVMFLASSREGWANVLLESMACGTPVVATKVNGTPEVVANHTAGRLAEKRDVEHLKKAYDQLMANYPNRDDVRRYAEKFSWSETTDAQISLFSMLIDRTSKLSKS